MALKLITAPASEPVTLADAKLHLRVDGTDSDTMITALIKAAREYCEGYQNRALITQTWELVLDAWPSENYIEVPLPPLQSITSIKYKDAAGVETTWPSENYLVDTDSYVGRIVLADNCSWPSEALHPVGAIRIRFIAGYGDAAKVPEITKQALLLEVQLRYDDLREYESERLEKARDALLDINRVVPV